MADRKMRMLLIHAGRNSRGYLFRSHPLGLMSLAAYVEREMPRVEVSIADMKVSHDGVEGIRKIIESRKPDVIGLSALTVHAATLHDAAREARKRAPDALILAGGPHATCYPGKVLEDSAFDAVVVGEGERPLENILETDLSADRLKEIPAVVTRGGNQNPERDIVEDLDSLPFPAWEKIDLETYRRYSSFSILGRRNYMSLFTSRACPYGCVYCHNIFGHKYRQRSAAGVLEEIRTIHSRYGISDFDILDDAFNLNRRRVEDICNGLIADGPKVRLAFPNGLRSDLLDDELLEIMRGAGTTYISFAIESASPRMQKNINKNLDLEKAERAIRKSASLGIFCNGFFMIGFPGETEEEMRHTLRFAIRSPLDTAHLLKVTAFDGTALYSQLDARTAAFLESHPETCRYEDRTFNLSSVPNRRFVGILHRAMLRFYLNPFRAWHIMRRHPYPMNMLHFARVAFLGIFVGRSRD